MSVSVKREGEGEKVRARSGGGQEGGSIYKESRAQQPATKNNSARESLRGGRDRKGLCTMTMTMTKSQALSSLIDPRQNRRDKKKSEGNES